MEKYVLIFDPTTGKPTAVIPFEEAMDSVVKPFANLWRDTTITQFAGDTIQTLHNHTEVENAVFVSGFTLQDSNTAVRVPSAGIYGITLRTQFNKNDAGDDTGSTAAQLLVNGVSKLSIASQWSLYADGTAPGDDDNQPNDKTKTTYLKLSEGDLLSMLIQDTLGNDVFGMQASVEWKAPIDTALVG